MDKKIYNYPVGNLSGHLEEEGHLTISNQWLNLLMKIKLLYSKILIPRFIISLIKMLLNSSVA